MIEKPTTVVFDFDFTLTRWDTAERFFRWLLRRDLWRLGLVVVAVPFVGPLFLIRATRKWPVRLAIWIATLGRSGADLQCLILEHARHVSSGPLPVFLDAGLQQLQTHLDQGHRVVVATGCLEALAVELLRCAGYGDVPLVGSTLRPFLGGMARDRHCFGLNKIHMLEKRGFGPPWSVAYTDHHCDLPVLQLSEARFLVNPGPESIRLVQQALASTTVLAWV